MNERERGTASAACTQASEEVSTIAGAHRTTEAAAHTCSLPFSPLSFIALTVGVSIASSAESRVTCAVFHDPADVSIHAAVQPCSRRRDREAELRCIYRDIGQCACAHMCSSLGAHIGARIGANASGCGCTRVQQPPVQSSHFLYATALTLSFLSLFHSLRLSHTGC